MSSLDFGDLDPSLRDLQTSFVESEKRVEMLRRQYAVNRYIFCSDLLANDVVRIALPESSMDGVSLTDERTLVGVVDQERRGTEVLYDSIDSLDNLTDQLIMPGGWGNLTITVRGGYFPNMLSDGFAFGYHLVSEGRANAHNLATAYSLLEVNGVTLFSGAN